jgi:coenzyme F420 biosynthesis associated uncharacterized protein
LKDCAVDIWEYRDSVASDEVIDWTAAESTARRLVRTGPPASREQAEGAVAQLRHQAQAAQLHVETFTKLGAGPRRAPALVVDRDRWITANIESARVIFNPLGEKVRQWHEGVNPGGLASATRTAGSKVAGFEVGSLLAFAAGRVLGQFDAFGPGAGEPGRLLLVAPNIVQVERELGVNPTDFRLWVCLHEETHQVQFGAVPWLREHILDGVGTLIAELEMDPEVFVDRLQTAVRAAVSGARHRTVRHAEKTAERVADDGSAVTSTPRPSLGDVVRTPAQRAAIERLTAVMTLLEGHATYVMDGVGPLVVPSVAEISRQFGRRRARSRLRPEAVLRKVLGFDAKLRQYRDGERFVRQVVEETGMDGFNRVWTSPNTLPTLAEIGDPGRWIRRVPLRRG